MNGKGNSFSCGLTGSGNSSFNGGGGGPAEVLITGVRLGGEHWWYQP